MSEKLRWKQSWVQICIWIITRGTDVTPRRFQIQQGRPLSVKNSGLDPWMNVNIIKIRYYKASFLSYNFQSFQSHFHLHPPLCFLPNLTPTNGRFWGVCLSQSTPQKHCTINRQPQVKLILIFHISVLSFAFDAVFQRTISGFFGFCCSGMLPGCISCSFDAKLDLFVAPFRGFLGQNVSHFKGLSANWFLHA